MRKRLLELKARKTIFSFVVKHCERCNQSHSHISRVFEERKKKLMFQCPNTLEFFNMTFKKN